MNTRAKRILTILGGLYHDFDGYSRAMTELFETEGWEVESTYDLDVLTRLDATNCQMVLSYTCLSPNRAGQEQPTPACLTDAQIHGIRNWVQNGGALLAAHCATVLGESNPEYGQLLGGTFISHPPPFSYTVYPLSHLHPIIDGIQSFEVHDEFYVQRCEPSVEIHMVAVNEGVAHPMVWSKSEGAGRVAHVAMGHFPEVWNLPSYQRLMIQTANWLTEE
jgi:uncharacterized protein